MRGEIGEVGNRLACKLDVIGLAAGGVEGHHLGCLGVRSLPTEDSQQREQDAFQV
jgi:hypothetical protein